MNMSRGDGTNATYMENGGKWITERTDAIENENENEVGKT